MSILASCLTDNDYFTSGNYTSQHIQNATAVTITAFQAMLYRATAGTTTVHAEVWSTADQSGSQIGGDSDNVDVIATSKTVYTFTWSANSPTPSADFFIYFVKNTPTDVLRFRCQSGSNGYDSDTYDAHASDGTKVTYGGLFYDLYFSVSIADAATWIPKVIMVI